MTELPADPIYTRQRERVLLISLIATFVSLIPTAYVTVISNSITLLADFLRCAVEHFSIVLAWLVLRKIQSGGKHQYNFGYGKLERLSSFVVALAMFCTITVLLSTSWFRFLDPLPPSNITLGFFLSILSVFGNAYLWRKNFELSLGENSPIVESQRVLFKAKTVASTIVFFSLLTGVLFPKVSWAMYVDPLGSFLIALYLVPSMKGLFSDSVSDLVDQTLEESYQLQIMKLLVEHESEYSGLAEIRTRKSGARSYIQIHLAFEAEKKVGEIDRLISSLTDKLEQMIPNSEVSVISRADVR